MSDSQEIKKTPLWLLNYSCGANPFVREEDNSLSGDPLDAPAHSQFDTVEEDRGER